MIHLRHRAGLPRHSRRSLSLVPVDQEWICSIQASPSEISILRHLPPLETSVSFPSAQSNVSFFLISISDIPNNRSSGPAPRVQLLGHRCYRGLCQCSGYSSSFQCHDEPHRDSRHLVHGSREPASRDYCQPRNCSFVRQCLRVKCLFRFFGKHFRAQIPSCLFRRLLE